MDIIYNENLWTIGHFFMWMFIGRYLLKSWLVVIILSVAWEAIEYYIPYEIAKEPWSNKFTDLIANFIGFYIGYRLRDYYKSKKSK